MGVAAPETPEWLDGLQAQMSANNAEVGTRQQAQIELLMSGLATVVANQQRLAESLEASKRLATERADALEQKVNEASAKADHAALTVQAAAEDANDGLKALEGEVESIHRQVANIVNALKVGNRVRKKVMTMGKVLNDARRNRAFIALQRRVRERIRTEQTTPVAAPPPPEMEEETAPPPPNLRRGMTDKDVADLDEMMDDGMTAAKLMALEQEMQTRLAALETRAEAAAKNQADAAGSPRDRGDGTAIDDAASVSSRGLAGSGNGFDGGATALELRKDLNAVALFVDELQRSYGDALRAADATKAFARQAQAKEVSLRRRCVEALRALCDATEDTPVESLARDALAVVNGLKLEFAESEPVDSVPADALLRLRLLASVLDSNFDESCDAYGAALSALLELLDQHESTAAAALDIVRLRAEFNAFPRFDDRRASHFPILLADAGSTHWWRLSERTSAALRGMSTAKPSDLSQHVRSILEDVQRKGGEIAAARSAAKDAQRRAAALDSAVNELVTQMQQGFASRGDLQQVDKSLKLLGDRLRSTKHDLDDQRASTLDVTDQLAALNDQLRTASVRTPNYARIERLLERKADVDDLHSLQDKLNDVAHDDTGPPPRDPAAWGLLTTSKCLACNRFFDDAPETTTTTTASNATQRARVPPGALATPGNRVPSVMPPSGCGIAPDGVGPSADTRPASTYQQPAVSPANVASSGQRRFESPPKKTMSLHFDGVQDSSVVIARAGANRLMPLASKRPPFVKLQQPQQGETPASPPSPLIYAGRSA